MRIDAWHEHRIRTDATYAAAVAEVDADPREQYADLILALRVRARLTQAEVAGLAGTTQAVVSRLEAAVGNPKLGTIGRVVRALEQHLATAPATVASTISFSPVTSWNVALSPTGAASDVTIAPGGVSDQAWVDLTATGEPASLVFSAPAGADYARAA